MCVAIELEMLSPVTHGIKTSAVKEGEEK